MNPSSGRTIHLGVNFIVAPSPDLSTTKQLEFQHRLAEEKIEFTQSTRAENHLLFARQQGPLFLQVQIGQPQSQTGQLLVIAKADPSASTVEAGLSAGVFLKDVRTIFDVFEEVWPVPYRQVVGSDAALHKLYDSGQPHAFQYLWEHRLQQAEGTLHALTRPVLGGGLRFVMPESPEHEGMTEVKIESFLRDPSQIYVEVLMQWPRPDSMDAVQPEGRVQTVLTYTDEIVVPFIKAN